MTSKSEWYSWDNATVVKKLEDLGLTNVAAKFKEDQSRDGKQLLILAEERCKECGVGNESEQLEVSQFIKDICENRKVFGDPIHGHIDLHPLCVKIVDTPHFQRLRAIKQLGACYYVYPGASHNRFEHSLGVCHLAGQLLRAIQQRQPTLKITEKDILCVEIAGLCHDLGQGPFSRLFDKKFIPAIRQGGERWKHGEVSKSMFSDMYEKILKDYFKIFGLNADDVNFIKDLIKVTEDKVQRKDKPFLYEIVANTRNGIDVKKWDYIARDCHMLGIRSSFDHKRCIQFARVIQVDSQLQICFRDKEAEDLYGMFHTRWILHRKAYRHRVTDVIEDMIKEAMVKSNTVFLLTAENGNEDVKMSDAHEHMTAYIKLTDKVIDQIIDSPKPELEEAKMILNNVQLRTLYTFVGQTNLRNNQILNESVQFVQKFNLVIMNVMFPELSQEAEDDARAFYALVRHLETELKDKIVQIYANMQENKLDQAAQGRVVDSIVILITSLFQGEVIDHLFRIVTKPVKTDYGMNGINPIDKVYFYRESQPTKGFHISKDRVSWMLPDIFVEQIIRVHSKLSDQRSINIINEAFIEVCRVRDFPHPKMSDDPDQ